MLEFTKLFEKSEADRAWKSGKGTITIRKRRIVRILVESE